MVSLEILLAAWAEEKNPVVGLQETKSKCLEALTQCLDQTKATIQNSKAAESKGLRNLCEDVVPHLAAILTGPESDPLMLTPLLQVASGLSALVLQLVVSHQHEPEMRGISSSDDDPTSHDVLAPGGHDDHHQAAWRFLRQEMSGGHNDVTCSTAECGDGARPEVSSCSRSRCTVLEALGVKVPELAHLWLFTLTQATQVLVHLLALEHRQRSGMSASSPCGALAGWSPSSPSPSFQTPLSSSPSRLLLARWARQALLGPAALGAARWRTRLASIEAGERVMELLWELRARDLPEELHAPLQEGHTLEQEAKHTPHGENMADQAEEHAQQEEQSSTILLKKAACDRSRIDEEELEVRACVGAFCCTLLTRLALQDQHAQVGEAAVAAGSRVLACWSEVLLQPRSDDEHLQQGTSSITHFNDSCSVNRLLALALLSATVHAQPQVACRARVAVACQLHMVLPLLGYNRWVGEKLKLACSCSGGQPWGIPVVKSIAEMLASEERVECQLRSFGLGVSVECLQMQAAQGVLVMGGMIQRNTVSQNGTSNVISEQAPSTKEPTSIASVPIGESYDLQLCDTCEEVMLRLIDTVSTKLLVSKKTNGDPAVARECRSLLWQLGTHLPRDVLLKFFLKTFSVPAEIQEESFEEEIGRLWQLCSTLETFYILLKAAATHSKQARPAKNGDESSGEVCIEAIQRVLSRLKPSVKLFGDAGNLPRLHTPSSIAKQSSPMLQFEEWAVGCLRLLGPLLQLCPLGPGLLPLNPSTPSQTLVSGAASHSRHEEERLRPETLLEFGPCSSSSEQYQGQAVVDVMLTCLLYTSPPPPPTSATPPAKITPSTEYLHNMNPCWVSRRVSAAALHTLSTLTSLIPAKHKVDEDAATPMNLRPTSEGGGGLIQEISSCSSEPPAAADAAASEEAFIDNLGWANAQLVDGKHAEAGAEAVLNFFLTNIIQRLHPMLGLKNNGIGVYSNFDAAIAAQQLEWSACRVWLPGLSCHLGALMPAVLRALDHPSYAVKVRGMVLIPHLVENLPLAELRWSGEVLLEALRSCLVACAPEAWGPALHAAVVAVMAVQGRDTRGEWYDSMMETLLQEGARHAYEAPRRQAWLSHCTPLLQALGLVVTKHLRRLLPLLLQWMATPDDISRLLALDALRVVITGAWPRMPAHLGEVWGALLRAWVESEERNQRDALRERILHLCHLMRSLESKDFPKYWEECHRHAILADLVHGLQSLQINVGGITLES